MTRPSRPTPGEPLPSQVSIKTVATVVVVALAILGAVVFVGRTIQALALTVASLMIAVALNHVVVLLKRFKVPRVPAIGLTLLSCAGVIAGLGLLVIPVAVTQGKALVLRMPEMVQAARSTRLFHLADDRLHIASRLEALGHELPKMVEGAAAPVMSIVGGVLTGVGGVITVMVLTVFMLIFGGPLVAELLRETLPQRRPLYAKVVEKTYQTIGQYLMGLGLICLINATLTTIFLAIVGVPFFLPLGIISGLSSLIPYAGPMLVGATVTLIALATGGTGTGIAAGIYFLAYGQLEGQVLSPMIFRRTVHVNPLVVVMAILFFGEMAGIFGAVVAVPAAATIQIVARELLKIRRNRLHLAATPLNSPEPVVLEPSNDR